MISLWKTISKIKNSNNLLFQNLSAHYLYLHLFYYPCRRSIQLFQKTRSLYCTVRLFKRTGNPKLKKKEFLPPPNCSIYSLKYILKSSLLLALGLGRKGRGYDKMVGFTTFHTYLENRVAYYKVCGMQKWSPYNFKQNLSRRILLQVWNVKEMA